MDVDYNTNIGRTGNYFIQVTFKRFGLEVYGDDQDAWDRFVNAASSYGAAGGSTSLLGGPSAEGRKFNFRNGNNDTTGPRTGALGLGIFDKSNQDQLVSWAIWYFDQGWKDWGTEWYRCGQQYDFWFDDNT
ncbi:hypothetical protein [Bacillus toyonensis]|uniref:hypothetical protein n=1 Tax=Bacillus toyonensis TaxID=155322 RepID=UPI001155E745|nr:hypothetical protein [Bacillus toyonensis]